MKKIVTLVLICMVCLIIPACAPKMTVEEKIDKELQGEWIFSPAEKNGNSGNLCINFNDGIVVLRYDDNTNMSMYSDIEGEYYIDTENSAIKLSNITVKLLGYDITDALGSTSTEIIFEYEGDNLKLYNIIGDYIYEMTKL